MKKVLNIVIYIDFETDERVGASGMNQIAGVSVLLEDDRKMHSFDSCYIGEYKTNIDNSKIIEELEESGYLVDNNVNIELQDIN